MAKILWRKGNYATPRDYDKNSPKYFVGGRWQTLEPIKYKFVWFNGVMHIKLGRNWQKVQSIDFDFVQPKVNAQ